MGPLDQYLFNKYMLKKKKKQPKYMLMIYSVRIYLWKLYAPQYPPSLNPSIFNYNKDQGAET